MIRGFVGMGQRECGRFLEQCWLLSACSDFAIPLEMEREQGYLTVEIISGSMVLQDNTRCQISCARKVIFFFFKRLLNKLISLLLIRNYFEKSFISVVIIVDFKHW